MRHQHPPIVQVDPVVDQTISLLHLSHPAAADLAHRRRNAMAHDGSRLVENRKPALPRAITDVYIFPVNRGEQAVKLSDVEKPPAVEHRRSAAGEHRVKCAASFLAGVFETRITPMNANKASRKATEFSGSNFAATLNV